MAVPRFFAWLVNKYPKVLVQAIEESGDQTVDTSQPNPNGIEFDNLFLAMNEIIYPCMFHGDEYPATFEELFDRIFKCIDKIFQNVRPRKLLYMAIDGVFPRSKMNKLRSSRHLSAKSAEAVDCEELRLRREFRAEGKTVLPMLECGLSDCNHITPGTKFMHELLKALQGYIHVRLNKDPGWKNIKVILSDANVPGVGDHKIMSFICQQRNRDGYDPNTNHCIYGHDADLIMLALATHEAHISILRLKRNSTIPGESVPIESKGEVSNVQATDGSDSTAQNNFQFLNIWTVREYLELDLSIPYLPIRMDFERIVDDFVFICFFVGNDFLPNMPTLEIHEGAMDLLTHVYKSEFKNMGGYLVDTAKIMEMDAAYVNLERVEKFICSVGKYEERIFKKRSESRARKIKELSTMTNAVSVKDSDIKEDLDCRGSTKKSAVFKNTVELEEKMHDFILKRSDLFRSSDIETDKVKLGTVGWKERYYMEKLSAEGPGEIESTRKEVIQKYIEGLCWVLQYYFSGVPSWTWFYPYHYAPFASDLKGLAQVRINFLMGSPLKPFDQLMAVLHPHSFCFLPKAYRHLMTSKESNIIDFYPSDFEIDTEGKRFMSQGITKIPFVQLERLLQETKKLERELENDEIERNVETLAKIYVRKSHDIGSQILSLNYNHVSMQEHKPIRNPIDVVASGGINGFICCCDENLGPTNSLCPVKELEGVAEDDVICALYELPESHSHIPCLLENAKLPEKTITRADIVKKQLWHEYNGGRPVSKIWETRRNEENRHKVASQGWSSTRDEGGRAGSSMGASRGDKIYSGHGSESPAAGNWRESSSSLCSSFTVQGESKETDIGHRNEYLSTSNSESNVSNYRADSVNNRRVASPGTPSANHGWTALGIVNGDGRGNGPETKRNTVGRSRQGSGSFWPSSNGSKCDINSNWRASSSERPDTAKARDHGKGFSEHVDSVGEKGSRW
ncbi:5'-3' exoribonuclease 3-like isoform X2 [Malania oleifera]|uniref:5'-3' exoribonuclease 3-like isoform X2 n=1 Tax=Malania oleifera TaxID=397392 RepID=UPI0025AE4311|nr:5'-3' exoribonuclease 3-like isoform X2 [Malania oleifera]